jgi:ABC-type sulfate transport system permease component
MEVQDLEYKHISNTIGTTHSGTLSHIGIPLASSASAGLVLGLARG